MKPVFYILTWMLLLFGGLAPIQAATGHSQNTAQTKHHPVRSNKQHPVPHRFDNLIVDDTDTDLDDEHNSADDNQSLPAKLPSLRLQTLLAFLPGLETATADALCPEPGQVGLYTTPLYITFRVLRI